MGRPAVIPETDTIYSLSEAAHKSGKSPETLRRAIRFGHLEALSRPTEKHHIRIRQRNLDAWVLAGSDARPKGK